VRLPFAIEQELEPVLSPIWNEVFAGLEFGLLRTSPVYFGYGIPPGDGAPVVVIPGFLGTDSYLTEMASWLQRIGYRAYKSGIGWNANCPSILMQRLDETVGKAAEQCGRPVHLIGHSLGGMIARSYAVARPDLVASVISLGSPFRGPRAHPAVLRASEIVRRKIHQEHGARVDRDCFTGYCGCQFVNGLQQLIPESIRQTAVYTKADGIVDWEFCLTGEPHVDVEVPASHFGLAFNPVVYRLIAERLRTA
jgi:triacylglycerol lipase